MYDFLETRLKIDDPLYLTLRKWDHKRYRLYIAVGERMEVSRVGDVLLIEILI